MKYKKIEVGKPWPGSIPAQEGAHLELGADGLAILIQFPGLTRPELRAFKKLFKRYSYLETSTPAPIAVWVFEFPGPFGPVDANFNARAVRPEWIENFLDVAEGVKNRLLIHVLDGNILRANKMIGLDPAAIELFHVTIRKQLKTNYSQNDFNKYLAGTYQYDWKELMQMGRIFKHAKWR